MSFFMIIWNYGGAFMSKILFTEEEIQELKKNKFVKNVTEKSITYSDEFKQHFIEEKNNGKGPTRIFIECGFNPYVLGGTRIDHFNMRMMNKIKNKEPFDDNRGKKSTGRPKKTNIKELNDKEKIEQLEHENLILKAENELLKKMEFLITQKELKNSHQTKDFK